MFMICARKHITTVKIRMNPLTWQLVQLLWLVGEGPNTYTLPPRSIIALVTPSLTKTFLSWSVI